MVSSFRLGRQVSELDSHLRSVLRRSTARASATPRRRSAQAAAPPRAAGTAAPCRGRSAGRGPRDFAGERDRVVQVAALEGSVCGASLEGHRRQAVSCSASPASAGLEVPAGAKLRDEAARGVACDRAPSRAHVGERGATRRTLCPADRSAMRLSPARPCEVGACRHRKRPPVRRPYDASGARGG